MDSSSPASSWGCLVVGGCPLLTCSFPFLCVSSIPSQTPILPRWAFALSVFSTLHKQWPMKFETSWFFSLAGFPCWRKRALSLVDWRLSHLLLGGSINMASSSLSRWLRPEVCIWLFLPSSSTYWKFSPAMAAVFWHVLLCPIDPLLPFWSIWFYRDVQFLLLSWLLLKYFSLDKWYGHIQFEIHRTAYYHCDPMSGCCGKVDPINYVLVMYTLGMNVLHVTYSGVSLDQNGIHRELYAYCNIVNTATMSSVCNNVRFSIKNRNNITNAEFLN